MMAHGDFPLKDSDDIDYKDVKVSEHDTEELEFAIQNVIYRAVKKLPSGLHPTLQKMAMSFRDIFSIRLGKGSPVSVLPMVILLEGSECPIKVCKRT